MLGIGWSEVIIIALVLLVFVGPKNLPPLLRKVASIINELKSAGRELRNQLDIEVAELQEPLDMVKQLGQEAYDDAVKPYEELKEADREFRRELDGTLNDRPEGGGYGYSVEELGNGADSSVADVEEGAGQIETEPVTETGDVDDVLKARAATDAREPESE